MLGVCECVRPSITKLVSAIIYISIDTIFDPVMHIIIGLDEFEEDVLILTYSSMSQCKILLAR